MITTTLDQAFEAVQLLVQKFDNNKATYMTATYSEAEARQDFIDNFFIALGWDVTHQYQHNPYQQDVKIEKSQKQQHESGRKRADYAFYNAPNYKEVHFFVEAKKPSVELLNKPEHYFQTIKYGWNASCPISILTDFEEFVIIDCRAKPNIKYALNGDNKTYRYTDYADKTKFAEIYYLLSKEAIANKSIEDYVSKLPKAKGNVTQKQLFKGGYQAIDDSFLEYIDGVRETIAKAFKKANPELDSEELTEATQRTVDRLVFTRFLEDKFIEPINHTAEWAAATNSWQAFIQDCKTLNVKYNGVVFKPLFIDKDQFLGADVKLFGDICTELCSDNSPYDFNYIPIHILGSIYERFLGKIVVATAKQVRIEEKPEVRKAGGVYYTPKYIVDYIVANTVGKLIEGKTPTKIAEMSFADIACGSGSFLIGVYDYLLNYHKTYYHQYPSVAQKDGCVQVDGIYTLSIHQKQEILLNNIYGVDIDSQAVEVTQLSLFLKMLEDETMTSTMAQAKQTSLYTKVLPDLTRNIVCGNSLIGTDILSGTLFSTAEERKLNAMDYNTTFPKIFKRGGFDAVVGNPPWSSKMPNEYVSYISNKYQIDGKNVNLFAPFVVRSFKELIKENGLSGLLIPKVFIKNTSYTSIRKDIIDNFSLYELTDFGKFPNVASDCVVPFIANEKGKKTISKKYEQDAFIDIKEQDQKQIAKSDIYAFITLEKGLSNLLEKIKKISSPLLMFAKIKRGIELGQQSALVECTQCGYWNEAGEKYYATKQKTCKGCKNTIKKEAKKTIISHRSKWDGFVLPCIAGRDIIRNQLLNYYYIRKNLKGIDYKEEITLGDRIYLKRIATKPECYFLSENDICYAFNTVYSLYQTTVSAKYLMAILNSKIMALYYEKSFNLGMNLTSQITIEYLKQLPIPNLNLTNPTDKQSHDTLVSLVEQMLQSKQQLQSALIEKDINYYTQKCTRLDAQIDDLVYSLYGLTNEEIQIVNGG